MSDSGLCTASPGSEHTVPVSGGAPSAAEGSRALLGALST
jgi:hypothetical protein